MSVVRTVEVGKTVSSADEGDPRMKTTTATTPADSELRGCGWVGLGRCACNECVILWAGGHRVLTTVLSLLTSECI